jgi:hypothetical protein
MALIILYRIPNTKPQTILNERKPYHSHLPRYVFSHLTIPLSNAIIILYFICALRKEIHTQFMFVRSQYASGYSPVQLAVFYLQQSCTQAGMKGNYNFPRSCFFYVRKGGLRNRAAQVI